MNNPLLVIVGQTATGKSGLALQLAERYNGEIICADSRTVYRGMDIGTAKPTPADRARVPHYCLDIADPDDRFTAADFKRCAQKAIDDIFDRGRLPILVGGTGLYVDSVLYDYEFQGPADIILRDELTALSVPELQDRLRREGIGLPNNTQNPRHLIRAIETGGIPARRSEIRENTLVLGLRLERDELLPQITGRVTRMLHDGLEREARRLGKRCSIDIPPMQTIGYQEWQAYFAGAQNLEETRDLIIKSTLAYAKRQKTWFKRNNSVQWLNNRDKLARSVELTTTFLNK
jgi:tRNA dimethylallyltransferase